MEKKFQVTAPLLISIAVPLWKRQQLWSGHPDGELSFSTSHAISIELLAGGFMYCLCYCQATTGLLSVHNRCAGMFPRMWEPATSPSFSPGLFCSGIKGPQRISESVVFFVDIMSFSALKEANNAACSFASPVPEIYFVEFFCCCSFERTQERLIILLSLLAENKARQEGRPR